MYVKEVCLTNIRRFDRKKITLQKGINIIYGENGAGKTTILEAINVLSVGRSFKTNTQKHIIKEGQSQYNIRATTNTKNTITISGDKDKKKIKVDNTTVKKISEHINFLPTIYCTPDSILSQGKNNKERQKNINQTNCLLNNAHTEALKKYNTSLKQRNRAIKLKEKYTIWDEQIIKNALIIWKERKKNIKNINREILKIQKDKNFSKKVEISIKGIEENTETIKKELEQRRQEDERLGRTTYGPHRDTISLFINNRSVKNYASQGEKTLCFAILKKAEANIIKERTNKEPIILLDDIFSKLDKANRKTIIELFIKTNQTIISHTKKLEEKGLTNIPISNR